MITSEVRAVPDAAGTLGKEGWGCPWSGPTGGQCVEAKRLPDQRIALRHSRDPEGPALIYTPAEMEAFIRGCQAGTADYLLG
ncbi:DUF397 domain-containing protein [Streptomyces sp. ODS28]|uniref:DUF397 domain-containing protein n=1 Tax=Streptomyces sp. ODS28 TaxID=3136688 RepID=UPI0031EB3F4D